MYSRTYKNEPNFPESGNEHWTMFQPRVETKNGRSQNSWESCYRRLARIPHEALRPSRLQQSGNATARSFSVGNLVPTSCFFKTHGYELIILILERRSPTLQPVLVWCHPCIQINLAREYHQHCSSRFAKYSASISVVITCPVT
ncbi:hypothetical protein K443DRAFT_400225 [Laccaria amethystina LaAM-08-1]|uniref:Uncharacterized protein n=1 Tax=Laccaria amethystina LaAM-08-1 TaxID=1095629 RepID=A0A0C9Y420_9AGAR|nr:hypothetical protein K443DRAFT_400225 [Laccaria amethystina LaAM-08-1]